jgi:multidrug efflux pump subunit AcrA (membrane-fusion protein)
VRRAALLLLLACGAKTPGAEVPTVQVKKVKFARVIEADGTLRPVKATPVAVPSDVPFTLRLTWLAADGSVVKKGDVVARFDDLELKTKLANAEADRTVAAAKKSKEALLLSTATEQRLRTTAAAQRDLEMTKNFAKRDTEIFSRDQIIESEIDQRLQTAKVEHASDARGADKKVTASKLGIIQVEANKAKDAIERSQKGLRSLTIEAPHDGVFTVKRNWWGDPIRVGDTVFRSMSVADVSLVKEMEAELFVLEAEASGLAKGKKAEVMVEGRSGPPMIAEVKTVETVAKRRQPKSPTQYFGVVLKLQSTDVDTMKPGQRVHARLFLHDEEALVVPRPALFDKDGAWVAYRREPAGGFQPAKVVLGASTAGTVTISSGLREGDVIALRDPGKAPGELGRTGATPGAR